MGFFDGHNFLIQLFQRMLDPLVAGMTLVTLAFTLHEPFTSQYTWLAVIASLLVVITFNVTNLYRPWRSASLGEETRGIWIAWMVVCGVLFTLGYATKTSELFSRRILLTWTVSAPMVITVLHLAVRLILRWVRGKGRNNRTAVVVGGGDLGQKLVAQIASNPWLGLRVEGYFDDRDPIRIPDGGPDIPLLGAIHDVAEYVKKHNTHMVYMALPMQAEERIREVTDNLTDTTVSVYMVPDIFAFKLMNARAHDIDGMPLISLCEPPFSGLEGWLSGVKTLFSGVSFWLCCHRYC